MRSNGLAMKTMLTISNTLFKTVKKAADSMRISRSRFFANAASHYLRELRYDNVTQKLNEIYGDQKMADSQLPLAAYAIQYHSLFRSND